MASAAKRHCNFANTCAAITSGAMIGRTAWVAAICFIGGFIAFAVLLY